MYRSSAHIYLVGLDEALRALVEGAHPREAFDHAIKATEAPESDAMRWANAIFADLAGTDAASIAEQIVSGSQEGTDIVLMATHEQIPALLPLAGQVTDIWTAPLSPEEFAFRFGRWQDDLKHRTDSWQTDQYLEATINSIPCLVWYKSDDGVHHKVNDAFCATVNKTKEQVQGQRHAYIWDVEADDPACIESERQVMETQSTIVSEETVQTGEGTRLLTTYKSPLYNVDGTPMGTVGVAIDITQERLYEQEILESNQTLETIFTSLQCGVITHSVDGTRILGVNQAALDILGYASEEELIEAGFELIAPSVVEEDAEKLREQIKTLNNVGDSVAIEYRIRHDDGEIVYVLGNVKLIENNGELIYQRFLLDYTDRRLEEVQKEHYQNKLIRALSSDYLIVCSFNLDTGHGVPLRVSADLHAGVGDIFSGDLEMAPCLSSYIDAYVHAEDRAELSSALSAGSLLDALETEKRANVNFRTLHDGKAEYCQATVVRVGDWSDNDHEVVLGLRNVDQQTRENIQKREILEDALAQANKASAAKTSFLSNMSHDIRTPMNAIVGFTSLAKSRIDQPEKVLEYLDKINSSSNHLLNLINDILDMSHIESGKVTLDEQPCDLRELMDDLHSIVQAEANEHQLYFSVDVKGVKHASVYCDRLRLNQILLNLIGNALKFTDPGGDVEVRVSEFGTPRNGYGYYKFTVSDTGIGMSPEFVDHIFDPFERERTSTISGIQGTGLGMAITKNLVDMMRGSIEVVSTKGAGSTFTVDLTFRIDTESEEHRREKETTPHLHPDHELQGARLLLVDDNALNREIAITLLEDEGFEVEYAVDGQDAIDKLKEKGAGYYRLVLMDIQMPVMNGYEAAQAIRAFDDAALAEIPIFAMTADAFEEDRRRALRSGMNGHLIKPIQMDKLLEALDQMLK